ncbi:helix-turn-helix domain-containing protein [Kribbella solani]|uniref:helix-turn-helix domain-containing protein n=1 Tax=Kribbella solani TaxID=236067 RepID=UPI0029A32F05|nr:helix-turn-helix domain-containing protein [Kribbella solani]MDX2972358.1 helix-turn-helix domain-containing protein [Kribbella solani]
MTRSQRRLCPSCGAYLAADNNGDQCGPCQRRAPELTREAPRLSDDFWQADALVEAAAERHFGKLLVAYRKLQRPEPTQAHVGQWLGLTQGQVSRIERSATPVRDLDKLDRWAQALHIPERLLWFSLTAEPAIVGKQADVTAPHAPVDYADGQDGVDAYKRSDRRSIVQAQSPAEGDGVHRRQFIKSAGVGLTAVGASLLAGSPPSLNRRVSRVRPDASTEIREMTQVFRRLDNRYGGGHSRSVVSSYLNSTVTPLLQESTTGRSRSDLFAAAAELHHLAGWMAYDTGHNADGHMHLRQALRLCHEADDERLASEMLAGMSHQAAFHGAPDSAVDLALAAQHSAKRSGSKLLQAEAAVMEAHGLALQDDKSGCLAALSRAEDAFNKSDAEQRPHWLAYFDHAYLAAKFAHAFRDLGLAGDAEPFARRSLEMTEGYERGRLFNTALLATILADQRRLEESCALGMEATTLASSVRSMRGTSYLQDLGAHLAPYQNVNRVNALFESMIEIGVSPLDPVSRPGTPVRAAGRRGTPRQ